MNETGIGLRHGAFTIGVRCLDAEDVVWLRENLRPAFEEECERAADVTIECTVDPNAFDEIGVPDPRVGSPVQTGFVATAERWPCFSMDGWVAEFPRLPAGEGGVLDTELGFLYRFVPGRGLVTVVARRPVTSIRIALLRLIREFAGGRFPDRGAMALHASSLSCGETGVLICGPKRAGKTSLLTYLLKDRDSRYIANDRSLVFRGAGATWSLSGIPTVVSVRADLPERLALARARGAARWIARETLARAGTESRRDRSGASLSLSPAQYLSLLDREARAEAPLARILFPRIDPACEGIRAERLSEAETRDRLEEAGMPPQTTMFNPDLDSAAIAVQAKRLGAELAGSCSGHVVTLGRNAYVSEERPGDLLRRLPA